MFLVGSAACVVESIGPLNITTLGRRGPDLGLVRAARLARPSRRRRLEPPSPTATVQQVPRPIPPLPAHPSALQRTLGVSTSSSPRWFCASVPASCKPIRAESSIWRSARRCRFIPPSEIPIDRVQIKGTLSRRCRVAGLLVAFDVYEVDSSTVKSDIARVVFVAKVWRFILRRWRFDAVSVCGI